MKTKLLSISLISIFNVVYSQVGINTSAPKSTLDVVKNTSSSTPQGLLIPRLTGDEVQAMNVTPDQNGLLAFVISKPTAPIDRTSLILDSGVYYYLASVDKWYNVNQFNNSINSALYSASYSSTNMGIGNFTGGSETDYNNPNVQSNIYFVNGTESIFNSSPYVTTRPGDPALNRGAKFLKSGVYNIIIQFNFIYMRDVAGDGANNPNLPDRLGSQVSYNMGLNFMNSPAGSYSSNVTHNTDVINARLGTGQQRTSGIAVGNIIVKEDNVVNFVPYVSTSGYYVSPEELTNTLAGPSAATGTLSIHVIRVSDYNN
ncbi:hypothetical protein [Chryseobacterium lathyri]|jgi:hypothetical protein|uniref:Uncharacterized protein n=1 Tax=Chryseobacterium lathyri TaxID=395933 RepID=A0A511YDS6_9FLAO|nr:hypothetical protein [Chryseobacterium lathyri]GEN73350.1 hypothetical protein CLA01_34220 [Chryseobacterium lathyri]